MIELMNDQLTFTFGETHPDARIVVEFQRTIRIPEGGTEIPRLPSLGRYPLYAVEEYSHRVPSHWSDSGGAMLPMYQSEAMWLSFQPAFSVAHDAFYPFAIKVGLGGLDAVTGARWSSGLHQWPQDFMVVTGQSWLGGYRSPNGEVQQFSAMPLGSGYRPAIAESETELGGHVEIVIYPMEGEAFQARYPKDAWQRRADGESIQTARLLAARNVAAGPDALVRQKLEEGLFPIEDWSPSSSLEYSLHLANSLHWCAITGGPPPTTASRIRPLVNPEPITPSPLDPNELRR